MKNAKKKQDVAERQEQKKDADVKTKNDQDAEALIRKAMSISVMIASAVTKPTRDSLERFVTVAKKKLLNAVSK